MMESNEEEGIVLTRGQGCRQSLAGGWSIEWDATQALMMDCLEGSAQGLPQKATVGPTHDEPVTCV